MIKSRTPNFPYSSADREFSLEGRIKHCSDWLVSIFFIGYLVVLSLIFPPVKSLNVLLWIYCAVFILLMIYRCAWWLWAVVVTLCVFGFIPNLYGVFNKEYIDGSILSLSHLKLGQVSGLKGRVVSLPMLGLPPSLMIWWVREKKILIPKSFTAIAALGLLMIVSCILVCLRYTHLSIMPFNITFIVPGSLGQLTSSRQWWQTGMPYTLIAFTVVLTFTNLLGGMLLVAAFNLLRKKPHILSSFFSALVVSTIISVLYGLAQMKGFVPAFTPSERFESTFQSQGSYGIFVGVSCVFFFSRIFLAKEHTFLNSLLFIVTFLGLFINKSRTAFMALVITPFIVYAGYLAIRHYKNVCILGFRKKIFLLLAMVVSLASIISMSLPKYNNIIASRFDNPFVRRVVESFNIDKGGLIEALSGRTAIWKKTLDIWYEKPLFGCGQGQLYWELRFLGADDTAASQYFLVLGELGIFGFILFLWVIGSLGKDLASPLITNGSRVNYESWLILSTVIVGIFVQSFTVHVLHFLELPLLFGVIFAAALASSQNSLVPPL